MNKKPTGRPRKEIDQEQFEKLCALHCTQAEICGFFDITEKTLAKWCKETYNETFSQVFKSKSEAGKISLRRYQFELAKKSATMAIFLGKNILGQTDNVKATAAEEESALDRICSSLEKVIVNGK